MRECGFSSSSTRQESSSFSIHGGEINIILDRAQFASDRETVACLVYVNIRNRQGGTRKAEVRVARQSGRVTQEIEGRPERGDLLYYYSHVSLHKSRIMTDLLSAFE